MVIVIDDDGQRITLRCVQPHDHGRANVLASAEGGIASLDQVEGFTLLPAEPGHVLVDCEVLRALGLAAVTREWNQRFSQMLAWAAAAGWIREGKVRLHVEVGGE